MKKLYYCLGFVLVLSSCSHRIVRTGYQKSNSYSSNCDVVIKKYVFDFTSMEKVGEIKLGEAGFSTNCNEASALEILKREACSLNADLINIVEEVRPDIMSSCYRCKAQFYRFTDPGIRPEEDEGYKPSYVSQRVAEDKKKNTAMIVTSVAVGFLIGFFGFMH